MKILLILLLSFPFLISADCGCEEVEKEIEKERKKDEEHHACRSCNSPIVPSEVACPDVGYECNEDWPFTANVLTADGRCRCSEGKCAGNAKLFVDKKITRTMRCNNSEWMANGQPAVPVICGKSCDKGVCKNRNPRASTDFVPLIVTAAGALIKCATGTCDPNNGLASIKDDGTLDEQLGPSVTHVACSGDGFWKYRGEQSRYVMCNASPCGPSKCPATVPGWLSLIGQVLPLTVTGKGKDCAVATCKDGFVKITANGQVGDEVDASHLTCDAAYGVWTRGGEIYDRVMCKAPPCKNGCDETPFSSVSLITEGDMPVRLIPPISNGCSYSCPDGKSLFYEFGGIEGEFPISIESASCETGRNFRISEAITVKRIGCWACDLPDGKMAAETAVEPSLERCVLSCPSDYKLQYTAYNEVYTVPRLYRSIYLDFGNPDHLMGFWADPIAASGYRGSTITFACVPN